MGTQTLPKDDPYTAFLKYVDRNAHRWNPNIERYEIEAYAWSTWEGVQEDPELARAYFHVSLEETNMRCLDNKAGFGYSGATWPLIQKCLRKQGVDLKKYGFWLYSETHPFELNRLLAHYFAFKIRANPVKWHNSSDPKNNQDYLSKVKFIAVECEGPLETAENK